MAFLWGFLAAVAAINCNRPGEEESVFYDSVVLKPKCKRCAFNRSEYTTVCNGDSYADNETECGKCASGDCEAHVGVAFLGIFLLFLVVVVCNYKAGTSKVAG